MYCILLLSTLKKDSVAATLCTLMWEESLSLLDLITNYSGWNILCITLSFQTMRQTATFVQQILKLKHNFAFHLMLYAICNSHIVVKSYKPRALLVTKSVFWRRSWKQMCSEMGEWYYILVHVGRIRVACNRLQ